MRILRHNSALVESRCGKSGSKQRLKQAVTIMKEVCVSTAHHITIQPLLALTTHLDFFTDVAVNAPQKICYYYLCVLFY